MNFKNLYYEKPTDGSIVRVLVSNKETILRWRNGVWLDMNEQPYIGKKPYLWRPIYPNVLK